MIDVELSEDEMNRYAQKCIGALISFAATHGVERYDLSVSGTRVNAQELGDWIISIERVPTGMMN